MKPEIKLVFYVSNLRASQSFYSAIGIEWLGGQEVEIGKSGLPIIEEEGSNSQGLPSLWGDFENVEILFYLKKTANVEQPSKDVLISVYFEELDAVSLVVQKLEKIGLFSPTPGFNKVSGGIVLDPDGHQICLCGPSPFRL
jgi:predicted lactoylglutathione lyase